MSNMSLMHIMDFVPSKRGALETFLLEFVKALSASGCKCHFLFSGEPAEWFSRQLDDLGAVSHNCEGSPLSDKNFPGTLKTLRAVRPMILSFWFLPLFGIRTWRLTWENYIERSIFIDRSSGLPKPKRGLRKLLAMIRGRLASACFDEIVSISEFNRQRNIHQCFIEPAKTQVIYNGVNHSMPRGDEDIAYRQDKAYFVYVGQLIKEKGIYTLLNAFNRLRESENYAGEKLLMVGDGRDRAEVLRLIREFDCERCVELLGIRDDVHSLMSKAVAVLVPSEWPEAFGFVAAEAMAAGTPVVASNAGALPEVVGDIGLLFEKGDTNALTSRMDEVLVSRGTTDIKERINRGIKRARDLFSLDRMVNEYCALFSENTK